MSTDRNRSPEEFRGRLSIRAGRAALVGLAFAVAASLLLALVISVNSSPTASYTLQLALTLTLLGFAAPSLLVWHLLTGELSGPSPLWDYMVTASIWFLITSILFILARSNRAFLIVLAVTYALLWLVGLYLFLPVMSG
jgi:hypothetical protein